MHILVESTRLSRLFPDWNLYSDILSKTDTFTNKFTVLIGKDVILKIIRNFETGFSITAH